MQVSRKGEAFPQIGRRSRRSSLTQARVIWTSLGLALRSSTDGAVKRGRQFVRGRTFGPSPYMRIRFRGNGCGFERPWAVNHTSTSQQVVLPRCLDVEFSLLRFFSG